VSSGSPSRAIAATRSRSIGTGYDKAAVLEANVRLSGFKGLGGNAPAFLKNNIGGAPDRGAAHIGRARAAMPAAYRDQIRVALHQPDHVIREADPVGEDLREGGLVSLSDRLGAGDQ
jgi:hypothetical protein